MVPLVEINSLESKRFGIVAARPSAADIDLESLDAAARAAGVDMMTVRIDVADLPRVHALEGAGFRLMDTLVYYERTLDSRSDCASEGSATMPRLATESDRDTISTIARAAFSNYIGHYHADPQLDSKAADEAYVEWAETSAAANSAENPVLIFQPEGGPGGFLTLRRNSTDEFEIVLNGVHPASQGKGVYATLVEGALARATSVGAKRVIVSTQINNYSVQRIWSKFGFSHCRSMYTFHKWYTSAVPVLRG